MWSCVWLHELSVCGVTNLAVLLDLATFQNPLVIIKKKKRQLAAVFCVCGSAAVCSVHQSASKNQNGPK